MLLKIEKDMRAPLQDSAPGPWIFASGPGGTALALVGVANNGRVLCLPALPRLRPHR